MAPKLTAVVLINPVPVTMTPDPPAAGPLVGEMPVTVGTAANTGPTIASRRTIVIHNIIRDEYGRIIIFPVLGFELVPCISNRTKKR